MGLWRSTVCAESGRRWSPRNFPADGSSRISVISSGASALRRDQPLLVERKAHLALRDRMSDKE